MTGRRQSARLASQNSQNSSPPEPQSKSRSSADGRKRKNGATGASPTAKRGKTNGELEQKTLDETFADTNKTADAEESKPKQNGQDPAKPTEEAQDKQESNGATSADPKTEESTLQQDTEMTGANGDVDVQDQPNAETDQGPTGPGSGAKVEDTDTNTSDAKVDEKPGSTQEEGDKTATNGSAVIPDARENDVPSSILEKGIIYFFFRSRVNTDNPQDVNDIARSYMIMRPLPLDAKLGDGPIGDDNNCRLLALPKKVLPLSGKDRFMTFVEKVKTNFKDLKESFMSGSDYATKTSGTSHSPPVTPVAEGIYAITSTGRESHLAYILTIPATLGEVQKDLGLKERGSFVTSVKNPTTPAPNNASLPQGPDYPKEVIDEFRGLRWKPLEPKFLDYENAQFLIIGEDFDKAVEQRPKDDREQNGAPVDELEKLEGEDEIRVKHLKGDDAVFADLGITTKDFPNLPSSW